MNYTEAVDYIETIPKFTVKHPPEHTRELLSRLGNPQEGIKIIHVAGTNGKGSVCAYLNAMLLAGGKKTGLFTSPHLVRINERFQINGEDVSDEQFLDAFLKVEKAAKEYEAEGEGHPSYFETLFLMGMLIFKEAGVDTLILGCTHYPLLKDIIGEICGPGVTLIDSGAASARALRQQLAAEGRLTDRQQGETRFYVSDRPEDFEKLAAVFLEEPLSRGAERIDIEQY